MYSVRVHKLLASQHVFICWAPLERGRPDPGAGATAADKAGGALAFKELTPSGEKQTAYTPMSLQTNKGSLEA